MRKFISLILVITSFVIPVKSYGEDCEVNFLTKQLWVLQEAFDHAEDRETGYLLSAITWKESSAGLKNFRSDSHEWFMKSYGPFQILLKTAAARRNCNSSKTCKSVKNKLMNDFSFSAELAKEEIAYWYSRLGDLGDAVSAYNSGNNWRYTVGQEYKKDVFNKVKYLKRCVRL